MIRDSGPISQYLNVILKENRIQDAINSQEFYYEKAREKFREFLDLRLDDPLIKGAIGRKSVYEKLILEFNEFRKKYSFGEFLESKDQTSFEYQVLLTIGQLVAYLDTRGYKKSEWNEYEDKRCIARANVYQHLWIINLLRFKAQDNNYSVVSPNVFNSLQYLKDPGSGMPVISNDHRKKISNLLMDIDYHQEYFISDVFSYFATEDIVISVVNPQNRGVVYAMILYHPIIRAIWDLEYKEKREEVKEQIPEEEISYEEDLEIDEELYKTKFEEIEEEAEKEIAEIIVSITGKPAAQADEPATKDLLGRGRLIQALSNMISSDAQGTPFTIGVFGNWGSGKSSVVELTKAHLVDSKEKRYRHVTFNAWRYEHVGNIAAGLAQETVKGLIGPLWVPGKLILRVRVAFRQHRWSTILIVLGIILTAAFLTVSLTRDPEVKRTTVRTEETTVETPVQDSLSKITRKSSLKEIVKDIDSESEARTQSTSVNEEVITSVEMKKETVVEGGTIERMENQVAAWGNWFEMVLSLLSSGGLALFIFLLKRLSDSPLMVKFIRNAKIPDYSEQLGLVEMLRQQIHMLTEILLRKENDRLVVFVDDLDRCSKETIVKTFEAIRLVMYLEKTITIIAIDQRIALVSIADKYRAFIDAKRTRQDVARDYLGKLIQLPIQISDPSRESIERYIRERLFEPAPESEKPQKPGQPIPELPKQIPELGTVLPDAQDPMDEGSSAIEKPVLMPLQEQPSDDATVEQEMKENLEETEDEINHFVRYTKFFRLTNPRQIRRLRNSYRILKYLEKGSDSLKLMFMLFLLEHLHSHYSRTTLSEEEVKFDTGVFRDGPFNKKINAEVKALGIKNMLDLERRTLVTTLPMMSYVETKTPPANPPKQNKPKNPLI